MPRSTKPPAPRSTTMTGACTLIDLAMLLTEAAGMSPVWLYKTFGITLLSPAKNQPLVQVSDLVGRLLLEYGGQLTATLPWSPQPIVLVPGDDPSADLRNTKAAVLSEALDSLYIEQERQFVPGAGAAPRPGRSQSYLGWLVERTGLSYTTLNYLFQGGASGDGHKLRLRMDALVKVIQHAGGTVELTCCGKRFVFPACVHATFHGRIDAVIKQPVPQQSIDPATIADPLDRRIVQMYLAGKPRSEMEEVSGLSSEALRRIRAAYGISTLERGLRSRNHAASRDAALALHRVLGLA